MANLKITSFLIYRRILLATICVASVLDLLYAVRTPIWNPKDEIAHYDYIERLSTGTLPDPRADIAPLTLALSTHNFSWRKPEHFSGTAASMGPAGKSYEAEQPPIYYAVLAVPHLIMKRAQLDPALEIRVLRVLSFGFVVGAALLLLGTGDQLYLLDPSLGVGAHLAALFLVITNIDSYATLGNDTLSALFGALTLYLLTRAFHVPDRLGLLVALSATVLIAVLGVKLSNLPLLIAPAALLAMPASTTPRSDLRIRHVAAAAPLLIFMLYCGARIVLAGPSSLSSYTAREYFSGWVHGIPSTAVFLCTLSCEVFNLAHIGLWAPPVVGVSFGIILSAALVDFGVVVRRLPIPQAALSGIAIVITLATLVLAAVLNRLYSGVLWHGFRHYVATLPFLMLTVTFPLRRLHLAG